MNEAREWIEYCLPHEYGNEAMQRRASRRFTQDESIDIVTVYEHGGWHLSWNRDMTIVGTANDMATLNPKAYEWAKRFSGRRIVGETRDSKSMKFPSYYPKVLVA
jgi:hypothetical protein